MAGNQFVIYELPRKLYRDPTDFQYHSANNVSLDMVAYKVALMNNHRSEKELPENIKKFVYNKITDEMCFGASGIIFVTKEIPVYQSDNRPDDQFMSQIRDWLKAEHNLESKIIPRDESSTPFPMLSVTWASLKNIKI